MTPPSSNLPAPASVLVIVAHADDAEFGIGGTFAKWAEAGTVLHHLVLTDGSKGTWDASADQGELVATRRDEQRTAAAALGATGECVFLGEVDGELQASTTNRARVAEVIRRLRPEVVAGHDPWKRYRLHPDHHAAGRLCVDGIVAARDPFFHPEQLLEGLAPHRPDALLLFEADEVNHLETLEDRHLQARIAALEAHRSQMATTHFYRTGDGDPLTEFRLGQRRRLEQMGEPAGTLAEAFHLIVDQL